MSDKSNYTPIFRGVLPTDVHARWQLIRRFVDRWCTGANPPLVDRCGENTPLIETATSLAKGELSISIRQWLSLAGEAAVRGAPHIRDCLVVAPIESELNHPDVKDSTVILVQGESDLFWTVPNARLSDDDPYVDVFQCFDEESPPFLARYATVSEFALAYICSYNDYAVGCTEWFSANLGEGDLHVVRKWFEHALVIRAQDTGVGMRNYRFCELLERENAAALVTDHGVEVSLFREPASLEMPRCLREEMEQHLKVRNDPLCSDNVRPSIR